MAIASAPGKAILFGEHSVVYPSPWMDSQPHKALAGAIQERVYVEVVRTDDGVLNVGTSIGLRCTSQKKELYELAVKFREAFGRQPRDIAALKALHENDADGLAPIKLIAALSDIDGARVYVGKPPTAVPAGAHLGSSSAAFAALAGALLETKTAFDTGSVNELTHAGDALVLGAPSGIDNTVVSYGGAVLYTKSDPSVAGRIDRLKINGLEMAVANTGIVSKTGDMVAKVRMRLEEDASKMALMDRINQIVAEGFDALNGGNLTKIGQLMNQNHDILSKFGLSIPQIETARAVALNAGAYGAKGTGAYGGGCVIAVAENPQKIVDAWRAKGLDAWVTKWGEAEGARVEA
ncbi:MAG: mevalonate kinase [Candidatus Aenigmatarchaeota archaeon]|nr:MAG: mevalonate kinase [Candidatus Aenigmarchaeota archaeon]